PAWTLWTHLHPSEPLPDIERAKKLTAAVKVLFLGQGEILGSETVTIRAWSGDDVWALTATTGTFRIPARTDTLDFELDIADLADPSASHHSERSAFAKIAVFGGELPLKHALFDNDYSALRTRIIEGGQAVRGADLQITYTDWRANTVVDSYSLDRNIGTART